MQHTDDLEYRLASTIRHLTRAKKPVIGFMAEQAGAPSHAFNELQEELRQSYEVRPLDPSDTAQGGHRIGRRGARGSS